MLKTGQKTVTTSGIRVALGTEVINSALVIKAFSSNSGIVYIGNSAVSSANGFGLSSGEQMIIVEAGNLSNVYLDASSNSQSVYWMAFDQV